MHQPTVKRDQMKNLKSRILFLNAPLILHSVCKLTFIIDRQKEHPVRDRKCPCSPMLAAAPLILIGAQKLCALVA